MGQLWIVSFDALSKVQNIIIRDFIFSIIQDGDLHNGKTFFCCKSLDGMAPCYVKFN